MIALERRTIADLIVHFPTEKKEEDVLVFLDNDGKNEQRFSFERLKQQAECAAQNIHRHALVGQVAVIITNDPAAFVTAFFGCMLSGVIAVPLPAPRNAQDQACIDLLRHMLKTHNPPVVLAADEHCNGLLQNIMDLDGNQANLVPISQLTDPPAIFATLPGIDPDAVAYLQYTSGSTLLPKGVVLRHKQVLSNLAQMYRVFNRTESVRVAGWIPFHHDMGLVGHLFTVLYESGFGVFMPAAAFLAKPSLWLSAISQYKANSAAAPTFAFEYCCRKIPADHSFNLSCWKYAYVGSETVSVDVLDCFYERFADAGFDRNSFKPVYGLAEVTLLAAGGGLGLNELSKHIVTKNTPAKKQRLLMPYAIAEEMNVSIHDPENGSVCSEGQEGEIWLTGFSVGDGYFGNDAGNAFSTQRVKTGDMGFVKEKFVYLTGRCKDIVVLRGVNYAAEDLEFAARFDQELLKSNDQTVCVSHINAGGESLVVFQEVHRHSTVEQQKEITARISGNMVQSYGIIPKAVILTYSGFLPRTRNHKLSRRNCLDLYLSGAMKTLYVSGDISESPDTVESADDETVIVGLACRFPGGADSPEAFWELLANGKDAITEVPAERWDSALFYDPKPAVPGKMNTKWAGFVDHIDRFDAALFGISSYEAPEIDPQQRLLLETSWRLLENTGWTKEKLAGSDTGVFVGISTNDYLYMKIKLIPGMESFNAYSGLGNANSVAANRISYFYDLKGPSIAIDTACSSSLTAFHLGVTAILNGECKQAVVGGVNAILSPGPSITLSQFGMMSPKGRCKTFDAAADGYVRAEGCGLVMLKKYADAVRDGDQILAVVRASATGQDGQSPGITFPNGAAQRKLLERTLRLSGCNSSEIGYIEAHGTGTAAGDPVEVEQLAKVYGTTGETNCYIGSVKANIGHLEAAAGIASVIKATLMLREHKIPPQVHFSKLNPKIELKGSRLRIPVALEDWQQNSNEGKKIAISSFGFGGSLAHVILEEPVQTGTPAVPEQPALSVQSLFVLSAHSPESLTEQAKTWIDWLEKNTSLSVHDICYSQAIGRTQLKYRQYFLAADTSTLLSKLKEFAKVQKATLPVEPIKPAFLFTGQGEYYQDMGKELYHHFPLFAKAFDRCAAAVDEQLEGYSLCQLAFGSMDILTMGNRFMQPVSFAVQYALGILLEECGSIPAVLLGHSLGEYAAACLAGCFEPEEGVRMLRKRGELIDALPAIGKMLTIFCAPEEVVLQLDAGKASIAAVNSADKTVVAGDAEEIDRLAALFSKKEIRVAEIKAPQAFHSLLMDPVLDPFHEYLRHFTFMPPSKKWISSLTGKLMKEAPDASYWVAHLRQKVNFDQAVRVLDAEKIKQYVEIGPGSGTLLSISESLDCSNALLLRTLNFKKGDRTEMYFLLDTIGQLYRSGMNLHAAAILKGNFYPNRIPGQTFKQIPYWMEGLSAAKLSAFANKQGEPVLPDPPEVKPIHYHIKWVESADHSEMLVPETAKESNWIVVGDNGAFAKAIITTLRECKAPVYYITTSSGSGGALSPDLVISNTPDKKEWRKALDTVVNFKSQVNITSWKLLFICENHFKPAIQQNELGSDMNLLLPMVHALQESIPMARLWLVTEQAQFVEEAGQTGTQLNLPASIVWGFGKTLFLEHPEWRGGMIDAEGDEPSAKILIQKISKPGPGAEACIAIRNGKQYVQKILPAEQLPITKAVFRNDGAYIITGGLGGLGLKAASWLADKGIKHLVLTSRRKLAEQQQWLGLTPSHKDYETVQNLLALAGKGVKVEMVSADTRDAKAMEQLMTSLDDNKIPVRGVIHAAGVNWFSKIMQMDQQQLQATLKIKTEASWLLHRLTAERDLDCFILFSSVSALWGSVDLSHYTAANHFMDMLSWYRHASGLPSCSINWGPWDEVGMSAGDREREVLGKLGFTLLPSAEALAAMDGVLAAGWPLSLITALDWQKFRLFSDFSLAPSLFSEVTNVDINEKRSQQNAVAIIQSATPGEARALIEEAVRTELRMVMLIESMDAIHEEQRFNFLGMDSLMAITFVVHLEEYFECKLPSTLVYNYPTIGAVRDYLFDLVYANGSTHAQTAPVSEAAKPAAVPVSSAQVVLKECAAPDKTTLFCFPYAGSGASAYAKWPLHFNGTMEIIAMQPPGRENRSNETPYSSIEDIVAELLDNHADPEGDFYFFGHSLGALIAYEFYVALKKNHRKLPEKIFLCGCGAPLVAFEGKIHQLDGDAFIEAIAQSYGEAEWPVERRNAIQYNYELLKSDIQALENYQSKLEPIEVPVVAICGLQDRIAPPEEVEKWSQLAKTVFSLKNIDGAHDLVSSHAAELTQIIRSMLLSRDPDHFHTPNVVL